MLEISEILILATNRNICVFYATYINKKIQFISFKHVLVKISKVRFAVTSLLCVYIARHISEL